MKIVEVTTPHRCCGRCGATPYQARKEKLACYAYGVKYNHHVWIWWDPNDR